MEKTSDDIAAQKYFRTGKSGGVNSNDLAAACDRAIQQTARKSFKSALSLARRFAKQAGSDRGPLGLTASRALARMTHLSGLHREALSAYLKARELAADDPLIRGRIDRALIDVYMYLGDFTRARQAARRAITTFIRINSDVELARTQVNYANVLHRQDKHRDAERLYAEAATFFETSGDQVSAAKCYFNQANTLVQLFDLTSAEKLYEKARKIYEAEEFDLDACDARYGLAWLRMLTGRFHVALLELTACENIYREAGDLRGEILCSLDRAEVYLSLGLYRDALDAARYSEKRFAGMNLRYEQSKAALFRGQAASAMENKGEAQSSLNRAMAGFAAEKNNGFIGAAYLLAAEITGSKTQLSRNNLQQARRHFSRAQLPLWSAVCDLREVSDAKRAEAALERLEKNDAAHRVPYLYALWQTAYGDFEYDRGRRAAACKRWRQAADRLDAVRAQLPPIELRTTFGRTQGSPHRRLIAAEIENDITRAAVWSERYKTAGVWSTIRLDPKNLSAREKVGESLNTLAQQVATLARNIESSTGQRRLSAHTASRALTRLQNDVRDRLFELERHHRGQVDSDEKIIHAIKKVSRDLPVIQFHLQEDDILAFVHDRGGTRLCKLPDTGTKLMMAMRWWRFILEGEILSGYLGASGRRNSEVSLWAELGEWLWKPLEIDSHHSRVLILPEGELANLPWSALMVDKEPLLRRHRFIISPSLRHYLASQSHKAKSNRVEIFRGQTTNLPHADYEIESITKHARKLATMHNPASRSDWPSSGEAFLWHYAGHAQLRSDNPFYSYLLLDDGPLFAADFRLKQCRVNLVTLAACRSGEQIAVPGEEATGLVRSLLEMGARTVLAGLWPVADESTAIWMNSFYDRLFKGDGILEAHYQASSIVREKYPSAYHWAAFSVFGADDSGGKNVN